VHLNLHATLHKALEQAVTPPRPEEVQRLLRVARGERFEALYMLAVTTRTHQGQLLGLEWDDVDFKQGVVRVRRIVWEGWRRSRRPPRPTAPFFSPAW
jgi:integrase